MKKTLGLLSTLLEKEDFDAITTLCQRILSATSGIKCDGEEEESYVKEVEGMLKRWEGMSLIEVRTWFGLGLTRR